MKTLSFELIELVKKIKKRKIYLVILTLVAMTTCTEEKILDEQDDSFLTVENAKEWYEKQMVEKGGNIELFRSSGSNKKNKLIPNWSKSFSKGNKEFGMVETRLKGEYGFSFVLEENIMKYYETKNSAYLHSESRLIVRTNKKTKETDGFIMTVIPSISYIETGKSKTLEKMAYLERDKKFNGFVIYHNLEGYYTNGWQYVDGKAYALGKKESSKDMNLRSYGCTAVIVEVYNPYAVGGDYYYEEGQTVFELEFENRQTYTIWICAGGGGTSGTPAGDGNYNPSGGTTGGSGKPGNDTQDQNSTPSPCDAGANGNASNNTMLSNNTIKTGMDAVMRGKISAINEWSMSVGRNPNGSYSLSSPQEMGPMGGDIPAAPAGTTYVANAHTHNSTYGAPTVGDLYAFLEAAGYHTSLETMFVYGTDWYNNQEVYAINIYDRQAASDFLANYPKNTNFNQYSNNFVDGTNIGYDYNGLKTSNSNYEFNGVSYNYMPAAVALAYIMNKYNMGVTLSRKGSGSFEIINAKDKDASGTTVSINGCE